VRCRAFRQDAQCTGWPRKMQGRISLRASTELHGGCAGQQVCRDLAHLYHYYLHGEHGNLDAAQREASTLL
jgi:hypothetical protein